MRSAFQVTVRRPVAILMVTLSAVVFGIFSYRLLQMELMPDITYPSLTVRTEYSGAAPQEVEENVTRPIEEALGVVGGLIRLSSISRAGLSDVTLEFTWDTRMNQAWQEVTERLDAVFLPEDAGKPLILRYDPSLDPVLRLALASENREDQGPEGLKRLRTYAEQEVKRRLEQVEGVASVRVLGGLEEQISVALNEEALRRTGLSIEEVGRRLAAENVNLAGGDIKEGDTEYLVRTVNEFRTLPEIADLVVARLDGRDVRLRDVGTVRSGWADRKVITRLDRAEAVQVEIQKEADANLVRMAATVREALGAPRGPDRTGGKGIRALLPRGWRLELVSDRSKFIRSSVNEVRNTALIGGILAVLVLFLFLRDFRTTAVISVAIPVSVAATFAPMNLSGLSLNIMSLGGLALGIGMLVDSGIVVVESIARCREEGDELRDAVVRGTSEVGGAVTASTLTTVAVFFPMVFVVGVAGQVFGDLALTVVYALLASLLVSIFLVPALMARTGAFEGQAAADLRERLAGTFRYRSLGPLSGDDQPAATRWLSRALLAVPSLLILALALRWAFPAAAAGADPKGGIAGPAMLAAAPAVLLMLLALPANYYLRIRRWKGWKGTLGGLPYFLLFDPALLVAESAWLAVLQVLAVVSGIAWIVLRVSGLLLRGLLWPFLRLFDTAMPRLQSFYPRLIRAALAHRGPVLAGAGVCLALMVVGFLGLDQSLIPEVHQGEFDVEMTLPVGTPLERTLAAVRPAEDRAVTDPRVQRALLRVGADPEADSQPEEGENTARLTVRLADPPRPAGVLGGARALVRELVDGTIHAREGGAAAVREEETVADLRGVVARLPEVQGKITRPVLFSFRTPVVVEVEGYDLAELRRVGERVRAALEAIPGLTDVKSTAREGSPEIQIRYDRQALTRLGLDLRQVADLVRTKVQGSSATEYRRRERRIDVVVRLRKEDRTTVRQLRNVVVNPGGTIPIPLSAVADVEVATGPADIRRVGQRRVALVQANLAGIGLGRASREIRKKLSAMVWPEGTAWRITGQVQEMERSSRSLWIALGMSIFLVYVVMASQFESLLHPLLIMVTVPLALLGVVLVLHLFAIPISVVVFLGMIMLAGIVVNNAIVLVDYVNTLRRRGLPLEEALVEAGRVRLRPILMTTATTVLGLLPMAMGLGDGAEIRTPMALTVIAGLLSSTVLTLVILPTLYLAAERAVGGIRSRREGTNRA